MIPERLKKILEFWIEKKKVGSITVNFFRGGISSVMLKETQKISPDFPYERKGRDEAEGN